MKFEKGGYMGPINQKFNEVSDLFTQYQQATDLTKINQLSQQVITVFKEIMEIIKQNPEDTEVSTKFREKMEDWKIIHGDKLQLIEESNEVLRQMADKIEFITRKNR